MTWGSYFWEVYSNTMYFDQLVFDVESWSRLWIEINPFYMHFEFAIELYFQKTTQKHVSIKEETKNGFRSQKSCWELCQSNYEGHTSSSRWQFHGESENLLPRRWRTFRAPFEKILTLLKYIIKHAILCFHFLFTEVRYL